MSTYTSGQVVALTVNWTSSGSAVNPTTVTLEVLEPGAAAFITYTSSTGNPITNPQTGQYTISLSTLGIQPGTWAYRWIAAGSYAGVSEGSFLVTASAVDPVPIIVPDYIIAWVPAETSYHVGETATVAWTITRADGGLVPVPTTESVTITLPDGTTATINAAQLVDTYAFPATPMQVGYVYTFAIAGNYRLEFSVQLSTGVGPTQTRESVQMIAVLN